jgi:dipeptidyl aminopeptidase/acylaminoacyl peptidase
MTPRYRFEQYTATRLMTGVVAYAPSGERIAYVDNTSGQFNLWTIPSGGGYPRQLTTFEDSTVRDLRWSPDGATIAFVADSDGDEFHQVYLIPAGGGWPQRITDAPKAQHVLGSWHPHGSQLTYSANDDEPANVDAIAHDLASGQRKRIMTGHRHYAGDYSPDGRFLAVIRFEGNTDQNIFVVEAESGEAMLATPHEGDAIFIAEAWSADGRGLYMLTNAGREYRGLAYFHLNDARWDWVYALDHDVEYVLVSEDGSTLICVVNVDGTSQLWGRDLHTGVDLDLPDLPLGAIGGAALSPDGGRLAYVAATPKTATSLFELDLRSGELVELTQTMLGGVDPAHMVEPELIHYATFDGRQIPAWLYRPLVAPDRAGAYPMVLSIHGGPESQERVVYNYNGLYQYLLNRGIAVLAPNIRGSAGYGITYQKLIHRDWGGDELKDIEYAARYMQGLSWVDNARLAVFGGSFGGFATLSALTRLPEYWAVGVDLVGPANLVTFVKAVPPHWRPSMKRWVGDPEEDFDMLMARSPITYVDNIRAPLLVIQGANDPRVVQAESDQMVARIRENGGDVTYYVDPEEGHGTTRRRNNLKWMRMTAEYLEEKLLGGVS